MREPNGTKRSKRARRDSAGIKAADHRHRANYHGILVATYKYNRQLLDITRAIPGSAACDRGTATAVLVHVDM